MPSVFFEGATHWVPGVYFATKVSSSQAGPLPAFHIPMLLGGGDNGHPYNADDALVVGETPFTPFKLCKTDTAAAAYFGAETPIHKALRVAKRHDLPFAYVCNLSPMTRGSIVAQSTGPVNELTLYPKNFGPMGPWQTIKFAANVLTTRWVKRYVLLAANALSSATRIYLSGAAAWLTVGASVTVGSNAVIGASRTIVNAGVEITAAGQRSYWVEISSAIGSALNTSDYAVILQYADSTEVSPTLATAQAVIDWINEFSQYWVAVKHADFTNAALMAIAAATPIKEATTWGTRVVGTAPTPTSADVTAFIARMNAGDWAAFAVREQVLPQAYYLAMSDSTSHGLMRDYAAAERTRGSQFAISVTTGCAWGDTAVDAVDDTNPEVRAAALNSQNVMLCAGGLDREGAHLSMGAAHWGRRVAGGPGHNLTNDVLIFSELETPYWDEINSGELTNLLKKGVATYRLVVGQSVSYRIAQGLSTLQANAGTIWNESDATTYSVTQRDLADFVDRAFNSTYESDLVGADKIDRNAIAAKLVARAAQLVQRGYATSLLITGITLNAGANGWDVTTDITHPVTGDFFTHLTTIRI